MRARSAKLSKILLYILVVVLPLNLGLHFISASAYVGGLLVDYLVPTIFIQDIVALLLVISWIVETRGNLIKTLSQRNFIAVFLLLFVLFLSVLIAPRIVPASYVFLRWLLYSLVGLYVSSEFDFVEDTRRIFKIVSWWLVFLGVLALLQYLNQGSVFNNYLMLGEQPYTASTPLIAKENIFGSTRIPAYGLFRHPNAFGGFLAILTLWSLYGFKTKTLGKKLFWPAFLFGIVGLIFTFSYFAWAAFLIGLVLLATENNRILRRVTTAAIFFVVFLALFLHKVGLPSSLMQNTSVSRRVELLSAGHAILTERAYLFGAGLNSSPTIIENYLTPAKYLRFVQPPHSVFVLLAMETGVLGLIMFVFILWRAVSNVRKYNYILYVSIFQIVFLSSFDHYFLTIQQTFLLLWLVLGLSLREISR